MEFRFMIIIMDIITTKSKSFLRVRHSEARMPFRRVRMFPGFPPSNLIFLLLPQVYIFSWNHLTRTLVLRPRSRLEHLSFLRCTEARTDPTHIHQIVNLLLYPITSPPSNRGCQ